MAYCLEKGTAFIKVIYWGTLTSDDIREVSMHALRAYGCGFPAIDRIEDMRRLTEIKIGFDELSLLTNTLKNIRLTLSMKLAILTNTALQFGTARMFQAVLNHPQINVKLFPNERLAN
jgi:hypothetical protein